jgi:diguanylate cyclase (GGDEF)-like protein/PAS domain S-box-containing protein
MKRPAARARSSNRPRRRRLSDPDALRDLFFRLQEGIYITNQRGDILDANPAMLEIFGVRSLRQLKQLRVADLLVEPGMRTKEMELLQRKGSVQKYELQIRRPDGQVRTVIDTAHATRDPRTGEVLYHGILVDITLRKRLESQLHEQSIRDPLTGCFNRRYLADFERRRGRRRHWGCIVIDIDHFKQYNDRYGHQAGDDVLIRMSRFLMRQTRVEEGVVRTGGDEFVVLLSGADLPTTEATARRLEAAAKSEAPVRFSLGWAARRLGEKLEKTIARADHHMFSVRLRRRVPGRDRRLGR